MHEPLLYPIYLKFENQVRSKETFNFQNLLGNPTNFWKFLQHSAQRFELKIDLMNFQRFKPRQKATEEIQDLREMRETKLE